MSAARRRKHSKQGQQDDVPVHTTSPPQAAAPPGNLTLMKNVAAWCTASIDSILDMCDWHVQRPSDGGVLGFKAREGAKILAVAHLDFIGSGKVTELDEHHIVSTALDDRLGACLAYNLGAYIGVPADVVFCDKEEIGQSTLPLLGTKMLAKYNWIVELDRRGEGAVCYEFHVMNQYIAKHFTVHQGTFSDICTICHTSPVGAFNMAVGYEQEHTALCNATVERITRQLYRLKAFYEEFGDVKILHTPPAKSDWQLRTQPVPPPRVTSYQYQYDDEPLSIKWCTAAEVAQLRRLGWYWNLRERVFCRESDPNKFLFKDADILMESEYYQLLDAMDDAAVAGWKRDPDTGVFYQAVDDDDTAVAG